MVVIIVPLIALAIYLGARFSAQGRPASPQEQVAQLREQLAWHEDRLRRAKAKNWDDFMISQIAAQLADTQGRLARITAAQAGAFHQN